MKINEFVYKPFIKALQYFMIQKVDKIHGIWLMWKTKSEKIKNPPKFKFFG